MKFKRILCIFAAILILFTLFSVSSAADTETDITISAPQKVLDGKTSTRASLEKLKISADATIHYLYLIFWDAPVDFTISVGDKSEKFEGKFLHRLIALPEGLNSGEITVTFQKSTNLSEIQVITTPELPENVQNWEDNSSVADLLVFSTHADDEQLFFAGVLPLYATNENCEVQVVYFTDHNNNITRRHELLNGLWTVGVTRYPVISPFPDAYSESYQEAVQNLIRAGFTEEDALAFEVEQIRKFQPLVIIGQDLNGEYGHGQHILKSELLTKAVIDAADSEKFADSAEKYGTYDTPKLYLHLYEENQLVLDLDTPIEGLDKTPFELSQAGYKCHLTQQGTWFTEWLNGKNGQITMASQIKNYSPCKFGLYRSTVGEDILKNDLFENLTMRSLIPPPPVQETPNTIPSPATPSPETPKQNNQNGFKISLIVSLVAAIIISIALFIILKKKGKRAK